MHLYEDPRCPYCEQFETSGGGPQLRKALVDRRATARYTLASFVDDRAGGSGSKKAVNALRAALEEGKFVEFHEVLYLYQPEESVDGYTDAYLLKLAGEVEGLRSPAFDAAVKSMKYRAFVTSRRPTSGPEVRRLHTDERRSAAACPGRTRHGPEVRGPRVRVPLPSGAWKTGCPADRSGSDCSAP
ncbi:DsbA family protein [Streptomyces collinus]|uniref:DsbA family protein n=1 Tax=Streptomyces collinus TaxID=42684 RepID=UPI00379607D1